MCEAIKPASSKISPHKDKDLLPGPRSIAVHRRRKALSHHSKDPHHSYNYGTPLLSYNAVNALYEVVISIYLVVKSIYGVVILIYDMNISIYDIVI